MTENELRKLTVEQRREYPDHVLAAALLTTREEAHELLTMEGWEFVAIDRRDKYEPDYDSKEASEIWRRQIGGHVEWCELNRIPVTPSELPVDQCWHRAMWPYDPRTIED